MNEPSATPPVVLTIGGSDSGGCYGVQADLKALAGLGAHGACALTVVTAQNTTGLRAATTLPVEVVVDQITAVADDFTIGATKTGMLGRVEVIEAVATLARAGRLGHLVVDPVLVGNTGTAIFPASVVDAYCDLLIPLATIATPNELEARLLAGWPPRPPEGSSPTACAELARATAHRCGDVAVLVTGGRAIATPQQATALDAFYPGAGNEVRLIEGAWVATVNNAGTGDALSAAIAAALARGAELEAAVRGAVDFVRAAIERGASWRLGGGPGPIAPLAPFGP